MIRKILLRAKIDIINLHNRVECETAKCGSKIKHLEKYWKIAQGRGLISRVFTGRGYGQTILYRRYGKKAKV